MQMPSEARVESDTVAESCPVVLRSFERVPTSMIDCKRIFRGTNPPLRELTAQGLCVTRSAYVRD
jgi:hypothetical protein